MVLQMARGCGYGTPSPMNPPSILYYNIIEVAIAVLFAYYTKKFIDIWGRLFE
jgi:hypothetical protein